jgi:hypothetical protein
MRSINTIDRLMPTNFSQKKSNTIFDSGKYFGFLHGMALVIIFLMANSASARCLDFPKLDLSNGDIIKEIADFYPARDYLSRPRYERPTAKELQVYIISYRNILESKYGKSIQEKIIENSRAASIRTCSSTNITSVNYDLSSAFDELDLNNIALYEPTIIFLISSTRDFFSSNWRSGLPSTNGLGVLQMRDKHSGVSVEFYTINIQRNQFIGTILSDEVPQERFENLRLNRPIERMFNLLQGCGWHGGGHCPAREDVWKMMFNEEIVLQNYWKDSLFIYNQRTQAGEVTR